MDNLAAAFKKRKRSMDGIAIALFGAPAEVDKVKGRIEQGFTDIIFSLPQSSRDKVLARLDIVADIAEQAR